MIPLILFSLCISSLSFNSMAYDQATHALLTSRAFDASSLECSITIKQLGLNTYQPFGKDEGYFEQLNAAVGVIPRSHVAQTYEKNIVALLFGPAGPGTPTKLWLIYGAIREDDN